MTGPFRHFNSSPDVIRAAVLLYLKYPLSLRNAEDLLTAALRLRAAAPVGLTVSSRLHGGLVRGAVKRARPSRPCGTLH